MNHIEPIPLLRPAALFAITGHNPTSIHEAQREGLFVRPVRIGKRAVAYPSPEIAAINSARIAGKSDAEIKALVSTLHAARGALSQAL